MSEPSTPLMRQYTAIKKEHPNALLFFRLGDFYELFFEDAVVAARELQITLTSRNKEKGIAIPDVRRALPLGRELHCQADSQRLQGRHLRADGRPAPGQEAGEARSHARGDAGHGGRRAAWLGGEQLSGLRCARRQCCRIRRARSFHRRVSRHRVSRRRRRAPHSRRVAGACVRARCCSPRRCRCSISRARFDAPSLQPAPAHRLARERQLGGDAAGRLGLRARLRDSAGGKSFRRAVAGRLRAGEPRRGGNRGGRDPALRPHHAARLARSRRPHRLLRAAELPGARRGHRPQSRADRAAVLRRRRQRDAVPLPRLHGDADGQAPAARLDAAAVDRCRPRSTSGWTRSSAMVARPGRARRAAPLDGRHPRPRAPAEPRHAGDGEPARPAGAGDVAGKLPAVRAALSHFSRRAPADAARAMRRTGRSARRASCHRWKTSRR